MKRLLLAVLAATLLLVVVPASAQAQSAGDPGVYPGTDHRLCPPSDAYRWPRSLPSPGDWTNTGNFDFDSGGNFGCRIRPVGIDPGTDPDPDPEVGGPGVYPGTDHRLCPPSDAYRWPRSLPDPGDWTNTGNFDFDSGGNFGCRIRPVGIDPDTGPDPDPDVELPATDGPLSAPHPTIENISLLWDTVGDANGNATVTVRYRQRGTSTWRPALPLRRVSAGSNEGFTWSARHAGSLFNLNPGTQYDVQATLTDPDGPNDVRTISVRTRRVPTAMANAPVKSATPSTLSRVLNGAQPGDIVLLSAGTYNGFEINRSGTPGRPIVVRGLPGAVVLGELSIFDESDVHVENLTVNGRIRFNGSDRMAIIGNTINPRVDRNGDGIVTFARSEDSYIADNTISGLTVWRESSLGAQGDNRGEGILVTGPGHVIEHNRVSGMRDGISFMEDNSVDQFSIDVLRNDIREAGDDGIEADFCMHNCRIVENQLTNTFVAFSSQPSLGGPTYFVRNTAYNVGHVAFKLYRGSQGDVLLHNTVVKGGDALGIYAGRDVRDLYMRNNLLIGGPGSTYNGLSNGPGQVMRFVDLDEATADMNYNGYGSTTGGFTGRLGDARFNNVAEMRARTTETNSVQVGLNTFASAITFPGNATTQFAPVDLRLAGSSPAVNAGVRLPTINDSAAGRPDLGAFERGSSRPAYGPRN